MPIPDSRPLRPPVARRDPQSRTVHGVTWEDAYAWLRAENWADVLKDPAQLPADIRRHLEAENRHAARGLSPTRDLQRTLFREMRGRIREDDSSPPLPDGPFAYHTRFRKGGQYPLYACRRRDRKGLAVGREQILLDGDALGRGKTYFALGDVEPSPDHALLAWSADEAGSELHTIRLREIGTGHDLADTVTGTTGDIVWDADGASFFYVRLDAEHRPLTVLRHRLGTAMAADEIVYHEADSGFFVGIGRSQDRTHLIISVHDHETAEAHLLALGDPAARLVCVAPRQPGVEYEIEVEGAQVLVLTNRDALDFRIMQAPLATPGMEHWRDLVPHRPGRQIITFGVLENWLLRLERENGLPRIICHHRPDGAEHSIAFDEEAYALGLSLGREYRTTTIRFTYASLARPAETWDYDVATRQRVLVKRQEIPSGHDPERYQVRRIMARAPDGAEVPVSLLHRRDLPLDGRAPCLLYGYGAYGHAMSAGFRLSALSLVDRGFVYAIAHIRGGTDKGRGWYLDGKRAKKPNSFRDFIAAAETLAAAGYTAQGRIVAHGGSAGGMLMGAVANMAPALFAGIVADVPFVDVLNTMLDPSLPLTPPEWPEWGNPIADPAAFATIRSYSPYDNVTAQPYPAMLVLAGLTDPRVTYWEPAKWVAALRHSMTGGGPIWFKTNMGAGHGGASGRFASLKETALILAFALSVTGSSGP